MFIGYKRTKEFLFPVWCVCALYAIWSHHTIHTVPFLFLFYSLCHERILILYSQYNICILHLHTIDIFMVLYVGFFFLVSSSFACSHIFFHISYRWLTFCIFSFFSENFHSVPLVVKAHDIDAGLNSQLHYDIVEMMPRRYFHIDSTTGAIKTVMLLDHEKNPLFTFHVKVNIICWLLFTQDYNTAQWILYGKTMSGHRYLGYVRFMIWTMPRFSLSLSLSHPPSPPLPLSVSPEYVWWLTYTHMPLVSFHIMTTKFASRQTFSRFSFCT